MIQRDPALCCDACGLTVWLPGPERTAPAINARLTRQTSWQALGNLHVCPACHHSGWSISPAGVLEPPVLPPPEEPGLDDDEAANDVEPDEHAPGS